MTHDPALFARTVQEAEHWLDEIAAATDLADRQQAYPAMRAVLQTLRDRLEPVEAAHLSAQLPTLIRGIYYEGWNPARAPKTIRDWDGFRGHVTEIWANADQHDVDRAIEGVFAVLARHVTSGELDDVRAELPEDIARHFPQAA